MLDLMAVRTQGRAFHQLALDGVLGDAILDHVANIPGLLFVIAVVEHEGWVRGEAATFVAKKLFVPVDPRAEFPSLFCRSGLLPPLALQPPVRLCSNDSA